MQLSLDRACLMTVVRMGRSAGLAQRELHALLVVGNPTDDKKIYVEICALIALLLLLNIFDVLKFILIVILFSSFVILFCCVPLIDVFWFQVPSSKQQNFTSIRAFPIFSNPQG